MIDKAVKPSISPSARRKARHYGVQALYQWHMTKYPLGEIELQFLSEYDFASVDVEYFHDIIHHVPANLDELETAFTPHLDREFEALDPIELSLLRLGSYELVKRIDVPYRVVINEAVALAKKFGATDGHKFVNGVLDKLAQDVRTVEIKADKKR